MLIPNLPPDPPVLAESQRPGRPGDDPGRLLPEARQLLHDLDVDAQAALPVIANLAAVTTSLRIVCAKLEALVSSPPFASLMSEEQRKAIHGGSNDY